MTDGGPEDFINRYRKRIEPPHQTDRVPDPRRADEARIVPSGGDLPPLVEAPPGPSFPVQDADAAARSLEGPFEDAMRRAERVSLTRIRHALIAAGVPPESIGAPKSLARERLLSPPKGETDVVTVDLGVGKTHKLIEFILRFVEGRYGTEQRPMGLPRRVGILVPDHKLARELAVRINDTRRGACMVWKGSDQPLNPDDPESERCACARIRTCRSSREQAARLATSANKAQRRTIPGFCALITRTTPPKPHKLRVLTACRKTWVRRSSSFVGREP